MFKRCELSNNKKKVEYLKTITETEKLDGENVEWIPTEIYEVMEKKKSQRYNAQWFNKTKFLSGMYDASIFDEISDMLDAYSPAHRMWLISVIKNDFYDSTNNPTLYRIKHFKDTYCIPNCLIADYIKFKYNIVMN